MSVRTVAKKKQNEEVVRLRCESEWLARVDAHAEKQGMTRSAYIRWVVLRAMNAADAETHGERGGESEA